MEPFGMETAERSEFLESSVLLLCNLLLGVILFAGIAANVLVLLVFYRKPGLRTIANRFVINLMLINIVACLSLLPITLSNSAAAADNDYRCLAEKFSSVFCSSVIVYAVLLIAVDQYFAVVDPLHYHRIISSWKAYLMIVSTWTGSALLALLAALPPRTPPPPHHNPYTIAYSITYALTAFAAPFALITFIYHRICLAASGNTRRTRTSVLSTDDATHALKDKSHPDPPPDPPTLHHTPSNPSFVLTRPSPPRPLPKPTPAPTPAPAPPLDPDPPLLKPTLKNNHSFTKLSSLHIQFSTSTDNLPDAPPPDRRHSNIPLHPALDPEFENLSKTRSSSVQSNFYDLPSRSSSSTRSTTTSSHIHSSRSSSLNSASARLPPSRASSIRSTSSYIVHNIRHRISNASLFRYREDARAARISALVIVMALLCWLPFCAAFALRHALPPHALPPALHGLSLALLLLSTVLSPFLFAFRNRQIKKEMHKMFHFCPRRLPRDCPSSFYRHNFSLNLRAQTVHLFDEGGKKALAGEGGAPKA